MEPSNSTQVDWNERWRWLRPLVSPSLDVLKALNERNGTSLGLIKPRELQELMIETAEETRWSSRDLEKLLRRDLFDSSAAQRPLRLLEKIPLRFAYRFLCDDAACRGHNLSIISWEVMETYRKLRNKHAATWEATFRDKYWTFMRERDLHFFVGNMAQHPTSWLIIGLYYPPQAGRGTTQSTYTVNQLPLFDGFGAFGAFEA